MRHGFSDNLVVDVTPDDNRQFAIQDVSRLADMVKPGWLDHQRALSPTKWQMNAKFQLDQAIDSALFSLNKGDVTDGQRVNARPIIKQARDLLDSLS